MSEPSNEPTHETVEVEKARSPVVTAAIITGICGIVAGWLASGAITPKQSCVSKTDVRAVHGTMAGLLTAYVWLTGGKSRDEFSGHIRSAVASSEQSMLTNNLQSLQKAEAVAFESNFEAHDEEQLRRAIDGTVNEIKGEIERLDC